MTDLLDMEEPLREAAELLAALDMMAGDLSEKHQSAAMRAVVSKALEALAEVKEIWKECLKSRRDKPQESSAPLSVVEGNKSK